MKCFKKYRIITYLADFVLLGILVSFSLLECFEKLSFQKDYPVAIDIITALIPAVLTIITIGVQIQNEPIRGIPLREFERIRVGFFFCLTHMVLIFVTIFAAETVLVFFNLNIGVLTLDVICLVYSVIFILQEIPILTKSDWAIDRVLRKALPENEATSQSPNAESALTNTLLTFGIEETVKRLSKRIDDKNVFARRLLLLEIAYYSSLLENILDGDKKETITTYNVDIVKAIDNSYSDCIYLLTNSNKLYANLFSKNNDGVFLVARLTFLLNSVSKKINYEEKSKNCLGMLISVLFTKIYSKKVDDYEAIYRYLLMLSISTIKNGETWFIERIRDRTLTPYFYDPVDNAFEYLLTMFVCFYLHSDNSRLEHKEIIKAFFNQPSKGLNSEGYVWTDKIRVSLRNNMSGKHWLSGMGEMLKQKDLLDEMYYQITPELGGIFSIDDSTNFGNELFFDYCIQILLFNHYFNIQQKDIDTFLSSLSENNKKIFAYSFERRYLAVENRNYENSFYSFVFGKIPNQDYSYQKTLEAIQKCIFKRNNEIYDHEVDENLNDNDLNKIKTTIDKKVPEIFSNIDFFNKDLIINQNQKYRTFFLLDRFDYKPLLDLSLKQVKGMMNHVVKQKIETDVRPTVVSGSKYTQSEFIKISKLNPSYSSGSYKLDEIDSEYNGAVFSGLKRITRDIFPLDTYFSNDAIQIKFEYCSDSKVRPLNDKEIDDMIERDYPMINGYYRFNKYKGSLTGNFYVTRDKLIEYLSKRYVVVEIIYRYDVKIDENKIIRFEFAEDN